MRTTKVDKRKLLKILYLISKNLSIKQIAFQLDLSKQLVSYYIKKLLKEGYIEQISKYPKTFRLTETGFNYLQTLKKELEEHILEKTSNVYTRVNLAIRLNIIKDNPNIMFDNETEINNWIKQYTKINFPIPMTLEKTTKSIIIHLHKFEVEKKHFFEKIFEYILRTLFFVYTYLKNKYDIEVDIFNFKIIRQEFGNYVPEYDNVVEKSVKIEVDLGRKAKDIFDREMEQNAKAWIDRSFSITEIETNDKTYEEKLILMPEIIDNISIKLDTLIKNLGIFIENIGNLTDKLTENIEKMYIALEKSTEINSKLIEFMNFFLKNANLFKIGKSQDKQKEEWT